MIDFTPQWYRQRRVERRSGWLRLVAVALSLAVIGLWWFERGLALPAAQAQVRTLAKSYATQALAMRQLQALRGKRAELARQDGVVSSACGVTQAHRVLAAIAELTPAAVTLSAIDLAFDEPRATPAESAVGTPAQPGPAPSATGQRSVRLAGWAADDAAVGDFLGRLSSSCLQQVQLRYARPAEVSGRRVRSFEIVAVLPRFE